MDSFLVKIPGNIVMGSVYNAERNRKHGV